VDVKLWELNKSNMELQLNRIEAKIDRLVEDD